jgi:DNA-binding response OmpR family regulator
MISEKPNDKPNEKPNEKPGVATVRTSQTSKIWQQKPRILLIAEDEDFGDWVLEEFQSSGCAVALATTGREALALLGSGLVDVVVSEMGLPDLPGMDLLREVRQMNRKPKVILTTTRQSAFLTSRALQNGASAVLGKPFRIEQLLALVASALGN